MIDQKEWQEKKSPEFLAQLGNSGGQVVGIDEGGVGNPVHLKGKEMP